MYSKKIYIPFLLTILVIWTIFYSCSHSREVGTTRIRGKIVNPITDKVFISRDYLMLNCDTLKLTGENIIKGKVKVSKEGLYLLYIYPEMQTIFLRPGDSLAFHINIEEFDESLSFSGSLGEENNLLLAVFLENEQENKYCYQHNFDWTTPVFLKKIDSFAQKKDKLIQAYLDENSLHDAKFEQIIHLTSQSMDYLLKEKYAQKKRKVSLPPHYFDYCKILQKKLPDPNIIPMYNFSFLYINRKLKSDTTSQNIFVKMAKHIHKDIYDEPFKDNLLVGYCERYIKRNHINKEDSVVQFYFKILKNKQYKDYCKTLIHKNNAIANGKKFPNIKLIDINRHEISMDSLANDNKLCISFWDLKHRKEFKTNFKKIKELKDKYPDIRFVIINWDFDNYDQWKLETPVNSKMAFYQLTNKNDLMMVKPHNLAQIYLVKNGIITGSLRNMYEKNFLQKIDSFAKQK